MERLGSCNTYIMVDWRPGTVIAYYSVGNYEKVVAKQIEDNDAVTSMTVHLRNGKCYSWRSTDISLVYYMMYGISLTPWGGYLFAQQYNGGLKCLEIHTGSVVWKTKTRAEITHVLVGEKTVCCAKGRNEIVVMDIFTGEILRSHRVSYDNRFHVLTENRILTQATTKRWEVLDSITLEVVETITQKQIELDYDHVIWKRLYSGYDCEEDEKCDE